LFLGDVCRGKAGGGVLAHEVAEQRGDAGGFGGGDGGGGRHQRPAEAVGVAGLVEGIETIEGNAGVLVDEPDVGQVPARVADLQAVQMAKA